MMEAAVQNEKLSHAEHHPDPRTLSPFHARLNFCREAAGFILRMFRLSEQRPRGVDAMFRLIKSAISQNARGPETSSASQTRVPCPILFPQITPEIP